MSRLRRKIGELEQRRSDFRALVFADQRDRVEGVGHGLN